MLNWVFLVLVGASILVAAFTGGMAAVSTASLESAKKAVEIVIGLVGPMTLWLGLMQVLKDAGLMGALSRALSPVLRRLFPDIPEGHPAMGAIVMNLSANVLGLGNAATPFGIKAMQELDKLNPRKGVATNSMALFLAINTAGLAVLPLGVIAIRASLHSLNPAGIMLPSLLATATTTLVAIGAVKIFQRLPMFAPERYEVVELPSVADEKPVAGMAQAEALAGEREKASLPRRMIVWAVWGAVAVAVVLAVLLAIRGGEKPFEIFRQMVSSWLMPLLILGILTLGFGQKVRVYESFIKGAKESLSIVVAILPFILAILVAVGMFRASGAEKWFVSVLSHVTVPLGLPAEALPMAIIRPLSGSGAMAVMTDAMQAHGPDSIVGNMVSIMNGSTETTFYVLAVYFGAVGVRKARHTVAACLVSELAGMSMAVLLTHLFFG